MKNKMYIFGNLKQIAKLLDRHNLEYSDIKVNISKEGDLEIYTPTMYIRNSGNRNLTDIQKLKTLDCTNNNFVTKFFNLFLA